MPAAILPPSRQPARTLGELQFAGPGRFRFLLGHTHCCRAKGHYAGWCSEPERYDVPSRQKRDVPEPADIELAVIDATIAEACRGLEELEQIAVAAWADICNQLGYPPLDNDKAKRWAWRDSARPLWKLVVQQHRIPPDREGDRSGTKQLQDALWSACEAMARRTGWKPREERLEQGG